LKEAQKAGISSLKPMLRLNSRGSDMPAPRNPFGFTIIRKAVGISSVELPHAREKAQTLEIDDWEVKGSLIMLN
jgi:hypothetical protein